MRRPIRVVMFVASLLLALGIALAAAPAEACGNPGERACCLGEGAACVSGAVYVPQANSGLCGGFNPLGIQADGFCTAATPCGGLDQRACCLFEAEFGACTSGLTEIPQPNSGYCTNASDGTQSSGICIQVTDCGGAGQRACCLGEAGFGACQAGLAQRSQPNSGQCGNGLPGVQSSSVCEAVTPCGGSGQRACCVGESTNACQGGLTQLPQANAGFCGNGVLGAQSSGVCGLVSACGGEGQRACCLGEAGFGACQSPLVQIPQPNSGLCGNTVFGIQSSGVCAVVTPCGGVDQRGCCIGESAFGACQAGLTAVQQINSGQCANSLPGIQSSSVCKVVTACGGEGQRACCLGEAGFGSCQAGLVELPQANSGQCGNGLPGVQSSGVCAAITACGGEGQRACCLGEAGFGACQAGLTELPQPNSGQCGNSIPGVQSNGVCGFISACGGAGQRACCVGEAASSCQAGLVELPQANSGQCGNSIPGIQSSGVCAAITPCGEQGQRACCLGEAGFGACQGDLVEISTPNAGQCGNSIPGIQSDAVCGFISDCGEAGERACCLGEAASACGAGLAETPYPDAGQCGNLPFGIQSSGFCTPLSPCGGRGQRACCVGEGKQACEALLLEVPGCSGDCACGGGFASSGMCTVIAPIEEPTTGWKEPAKSADPLRGYADLHLHLFGNLAHGGGVIVGAAFDPKDGVNGALRQDYGTNLDLVSQSDGELGPPTCPSFLPLCGKVLFHGDHPQLGAGSDTLGAGTKDGGDRFLFGAESNLGAPIFNGWPTWNTSTHQQAYYPWLERAWRGGLRLTVMLAVTNEALCKTHKHLRGTGCEDGLASIDLQLDEARRFESFIDEMAGGEGQGWFRIVASPAEARDVIAGGKLAVVLGIEMDNLFNCKFDEQDPNTGKCTTESVRALIDEYYAKGVRHVFPVHNFDNAFGSPATWQDIIHIGNRGVEGRWWDAEACPDAYGFKLNDGALTPFFNAILTLFGFGVGEIPAPHAGDASCNARGLTQFGKTLIHQLIERGMMIDIDHMSARAIDDTLTIAESTQPPYPVVASHVQFYDLNDESTRHERMRTRAQLERIRDVGGMVAAMLKDDVQDTDNIGRKKNLPYGTMADDCRHSSKTWAQMYQYAVDVMGGPVAMGSDFNGAAGHVGPRFGSEGCGGDPGLGTGAEFDGRIAERRAQLLAGDQLEYPFTLDGFGTFSRQQTGDKTFDFNMDGLAHVGLLPDLVADLKQVGLGEQDLDPLFQSAEAYVDLWQRAEAVPEPGAVIASAAALLALALLRARAPRAAQRPPRDRASRGLR
jgi:microsomal dipeptidase-like Zn-dependent dipeptidase